MQRGLPSASALRHANRRRRETAFSSRCDPTRECMSNHVMLQSGLHVIGPPLGELLTYLTSDVTPGVAGLLRSTDSLPSAGEGVRLNTVQIQYSIAWRFASISELSIVLTFAVHQGGAPLSAQTSRNRKNTRVLLLCYPDAFFCL